MTGPLAGLRIIDLARLIPGDYATQLLADLGAEVVKVEQPGVGDGLRSTGPFDESGTSGAHALLNRGKSSVTLDLKSNPGREVLLDLLAGADALVDSFRPGVLDRLDLGPAVLERVNPRLVHVSITFHGHASPLAGRAGHDINAQALAGLLELAQGPDGGAARPYLQASDHVSGLQAALAVLAGLLGRRSTGGGGRWDVSMVDAAYSLLGIAAGGYAATGQAPGRRAALTGGLACYSVYVCGDGREVAVGALEPAFFARFVEVLGLPGELVAAQYDPDAQDGLRERVGGVLATRSREEWLDLLDPADCCVTAVHGVAEAMADPAARERGLVQDVGSRFARLGAVPRAPGSDQAAVATRPAPELGADTDAVLAGLGYEPSRIAGLRERGVV